MHHLTLICGFGLSLLLGGCGALSSLGAASEPLAIYELSTPALDLAGPRSGVEVVIEEPVATGALATERIMIRPGPLEVQYLPGLRWSDTAPIMVQTLMVRTLTETGLFGSVGRRPVGGVGDIAVLGELTDFQAQSISADDGARITIRLILRIVRERDAEVVATRIFEVTEAVPSTEPDVFADGFDTAMSRILAQIAPWILANAGGR